MYLPPYEIIDVLYLSREKILSWYIGTLEKKPRKIFNFMEFCYFRKDLTFYIHPPVRINMRLLIVACYTVLWPISIGDTSTHESGAFS